MPIDTISGPFCLEIIANYIAHETDTVAVPVPIMLEDGTNVFLPENASGSTGSTVCEDGDLICCNEVTLINFQNATVTEIPYGDAMIEKHGLYPSVQVWYFEFTDDESDTGWFRLGVLTEVAFIGNPPTMIRINHGGPSIGYVKIQ